MEWAVTRAQLKTNVSSNRLAQGTHVWLQLSLPSHLFHTETAAGNTQDSSHTLRRRPKRAKICRRDASPKTAEAQNAPRRSQDGMRRPPRQPRRHKMPPRRPQGAPKRARIHRRINYNINNTFHWEGTMARALLRTHLSSNGRFQVEWSGRRKYICSPNCLQRRASTAWRR